MGNQSSECGKWEILTSSHVKHHKLAREPPGRD